MLALARLAQLLLEPRICCPESFGVVVSEEVEEAGGMDALRAKLAAAAGVRVGPRAPREQALLTAAEAALTPHLWALLVLAGLLTAVTAHDLAAAQGNRDTSFAWRLRRITCLHVST